jgi:ribosomal protein S18 acetylase RimI-like enzyme
VGDEITIRTYKPGDPSLVCYFQYKLYEKQYSFNGLYEKEMLGGMAELYDDREGSQMWIAEREGQIVGDIAVIKRGSDRAQLRWFGVDMDLQGRGLGNRLLETAMEFCREKGYRFLSLGTLNILKPARHLYAKFGFQRTASEAFHEWDESRPDMHHETWECELR